MPRRVVVSIGVNASRLDEAVAAITSWARESSPKFVCAANVHMVMEAWDNPAFADIVDAADLVVPDGAPVAWALRAFGASSAERIRGPDLMLALCAEAERQGLSVGLYGSSAAILEALEAKLCARFPGLVVAYTDAPGVIPIGGPFQVDEAEVQRVGSADIVFVGLGCPKQEKWMHANRSLIRAPLIGVGAAFEMHSGKRPEAPSALRRAGLEWLFRLVLEPRRLWRRYARHNCRFVGLLLIQLLRGRPPKGPGYRHIRGSE